MGNFTAAQRELWRGRLFTSADVTERERDVIEPWIGVHSRRQREEKKKNTRPISTPTVFILMS